MQWLVALVLAVSMGAGFAQTTEGLEFEAAPANMDCLLPVAAERGVPVYPGDEWANQRSAEVTVKLTFHSATLPPKTEFAFKRDQFAFEKSVAEYVSRYRLPCFVDGQAPIVMDQVFEFSHNNERSVVYGKFDPKARRAHLACFDMHPPKYPDREMGEGNVILRVTFKSRGEEPEVGVVYGGRNRAMQAAAVRSAKRYRYTCDIPAGEPITGLQRFHFRSNGDTIFALRDLDLQTFLGAVEREGLGKVRFDFNDMGCPFDLKVGLYRPYARNILGEFHQSNPKRKPFMDWLSQLTMRFSTESEPYLIGQFIKVSVPCTVLDLT